MIGEQERMSGDRVSGVHVSQVGGENIKREGISGRLTEKFQGDVKTLTLQARQYSTPFRAR